MLSAVIVATGGGVGQFAGLRLSMTKPLAPAVAGLVPLAVAAARRRRRLGDDLASAWPWIERRSGWLATLGAVSLFLAGLSFGTFVASGADSSGYVSEAALLPRGERAYHEPRLPTVRGPTPRTHSRRSGIAPATRQERWCRPTLQACP